MASCSSCSSSNPQGAQYIQQLMKQIANPQPPNPAEIKPDATPKAAVAPTSGGNTLDIQV